MHERRDTKTKPAADSKAVIVMTFAAEMVKRHGGSAKFETILRRDWEGHAAKNRQRVRLTGDSFKYMEIDEIGIYLAATQYGTVRGNCQSDHSRKAVDVAAIYGGEASLVPGTFKKTIVKEQ